MHVVADLHLHSKYSRAVSSQMTFPVMAQFALEKGINILSSSDWTHPLWMKEIKTLLEESAEGLYRLQKGTDAVKNVHFLMSVEISSIYKQSDKIRRIHNLVFVPSVEAAEKVNKELVKRGANLSADGRPIVGLSAKQILELILEVDERAFLIPCHVWTPHFGLYGSVSGFDSIEEAFGDLSSYVYGIETGLSSDPEMNWSISELQSRSILSFSDAHSPAKMGREATVFDLEEISYRAIRDAIREKLLRSKDRDHKDQAQGTSMADHKFASANRVVYTVEFYPEEGKYHFSGHRACRVSFGPDEIRKKGGSCPVCHKKLTEGVFFRLQQLAGDNKVEALKRANEYGLMWYTDPRKLHPPYVKLVPLLEIIAEAISSTVVSQKTRNLYLELIKQFGTEFEVLLKTSISDIQRVGGERVAEAILKVRSGEIYIQPGFDGEYGVVKIWKEGEDVEKDTEESSQMMLEL
ncbi:MAG: helicase UvrD [Patescibacteria group bacterium]|nr:MAG: helicase UvrD [Patescibacteria group bacterium]